MTAATSWPAPAKLNLFLHVVGRRADGYHDLQTLFQLIDLCDRIGLLHRGRMLAEDTPEGLRARAGGASSLEEAFLRLVAGLTADAEVRP